MLKNDSKWNIHNISENLYSTEAKIKSFGQLEPGWHFGEGVAPNQQTIKRAIILNKIANALGFSVTDAFPGIDGEIMLNIYYGDYDLEFTFETPDSITYYKLRDNNDIEHIDNLSLRDAVRTIIEFWDETWRSSEYSTSNITTNNEDDGRVSHSKTLVTIPESRLSVGIAYVQETVLFAGT